MFKKSIQYVYIISTILIGLGFCYATTPLTGGCNTYLAAGDYILQNDIDCSSFTNGRTWTIVGNTKIDLNGHTIRSAAYGIYTDAGISNVTVTSSNGTGYFVGNTAIDFHSPGNSGININNLFFSGHDGIKIGGNYINITENTFTTAGGMAVYISYGYTGILISGNIISSTNNGSSIYVLDATNLSITNNTIYNSLYGINFTSGSISTLTNNNIFDNGTNFFANHIDITNLGTNYRGHTGINIVPCFWAYPILSYDTNNTNVLGTGSCVYAFNAWLSPWRYRGNMLMYLGGLIDPSWLINEYGFTGQYMGISNFDNSPLILGKVYDMVAGYKNDLGRTTSGDRTDIGIGHKFPLPDEIENGGTGKLEMKVKFFVNP